MPTDIEFLSFSFTILQSRRCIMQGCHLTWLAGAKSLLLGMDGIDECIKGLFVVKTKSDDFDC